jgi:hypothetical protein
MTRDKKPSAAEKFSVKFSDTPAATSSPVALAT